MRICLSLPQALPEDRRGIFARMHFDLTDLRLFLDVRDAGTITVGAERSHMTLASASERIRRMEGALGMPLFVRSRRGVEPTGAGRTLEHHARAVLRQMERMRDELGAHGSGLKGHVRLLSNTAALSEYLPEALARFLAAYPSISVDLEERASPAIVDAVRSGACDVGVVSDAVAMDGLETFAFRPDPLVLVVPRGHELAACRSATLAEAIDCEFVGLVEGSALQEHIGRQARSLGRRLGYRVRLRSFEAVCRMVGQGIGVAIVPQAAAARCARAAGVRQVRLSDAWAARNLVLCVRRLDELPASAKQLVQHILAAPGR